MFAALISALHVLSLGIGLGALFARRRQLRPLDTRRAPLLVRINDVQTVLVVLIPFAAAAMARGLWLFA